MRDLALSMQGSGADRRGSLLLVDDEPMVVTSLKRLLHRDHEVLPMTNSRQAFELIAAGGRFDLILCDLMMPDLTGMELHAEIQRVAPAQAARMIFLSGGAFTPRARAFLSEIPNPRLDKPFDGDFLRALVREFVNCQSVGTCSGAPATLP